MGTSQVGFDRDTRGVDPESPALKLDCDQQVALENGGYRSQRGTLCGEPYKEYMERKRSGAVHVSQHRLFSVRQALRASGKDL